METFLNEVRILSEARHQNVIEILYVKIDAEYQDQNGMTTHVVYYAMSFADYGELFNFLENTPQFSENLARYYFQ